jgi:hypothetical protein
MSRMDSLVKIDGNLTQPITLAIEKIAGATGILYEPKRITRKAKAEGEAAVIKARYEAKVSTIEQRAAARRRAEEIKHQQNIESIISKALPGVKDSANPQGVEDDWISQFFDRSRLVSDGEMQEVWARLLAGELNQPGSFSKRIINLLAELGKSEAELFSRLASCVWMISQRWIPFIPDEDASVYKSQGLDFEQLSHLASIGLIQFNSLTGFDMNYQGEGKAIRISYLDAVYNVALPENSNSRISVGRVLFTPTGEELFAICSPLKIEGLEQYVVEKLRSVGLEVTKVGYAAPSS